MTEEQEVELRHEARMYQCLYAHAKERIEVLEATLREAALEKAAQKRTTGPNRTLHQTTTKTVITEGAVDITALKNVWQLIHSGAPVNWSAKN